jgi:hypothetical protein
MSQEQNQVGLCSQSAHDENVLARWAQLADSGTTPVGDGASKRQK